MTTDNLRFPIPPVAGPGPTFAQEVDDALQLIDDASPVLAKIVGGGADDTAALQDAIDVAKVDGRAVLVRPVPGGARFSNLECDDALHLRGTGFYTSAKDAFGSGVWEETARHRGSYLVSTATSGHALFVASSSKALSAIVEGIGIIGPGSGTSVGLVFGNGVRGLVRCRLDRAVVANFATSVRWVGVQDSTSVGLAVMGCITGLHLLDESIQNAFYGFECQHSSSNGLHVENCTQNAFYGALFQANTGTSAYLEGAHATRLLDAHFESVDGVRAVMITAGAYASGDHNQLVSPDFNTAADTVTIETAHNRIRDPQASQAVTVSGSSNTLDGTFDAAVTVSGDYNKLTGRFNAAVAMTGGAGNLLDGWFFGALTWAGANGVLRAIRLTTPEAALAAPLGSTCQVPGTGLYAKTGGANGNTGWVLVT